MKAKVEVDPIEEADKDSVLANKSNLPGYARKTKEDERNEMRAETLRRMNENARKEKVEEAKMN